MIASNLYKRTYTVIPLYYIKEGSSFSFLIKIVIYDVVILPFQSRDSSSG